MKGAYKKDGERLFNRICTDRTKDNSFKLKDGRFGLDTQKKFLMMSVVGHTGTGCPGKLWMPHPWKCSKLGWMSLSLDLVKDVPTHS